MDPEDEITALKAQLRENETRYRLFAESWAQAVWETDAAGVVVTDSPSWRAYTGQTLEEWLGYGWLDAIHSEDRAYADRQWREAIAARRPVDAEFRLRAPDGGWRWTNVRAAPVLDVDGRIAKWAGISIDIDARKLAEAALRDSEQRYRSLFETMGQGFCELQLIRDNSGRTVDHRYLELNPAFERLSGVSAVRARGHTANEMFPDLEPSWHAVYDRIVRKGVPERIEHRLGSLDRWYEIFCYPRESDRLTLFYEDITERKRAEAALRESEERQAFLLRLSDSLRPVRDPITVQEVAARLLGEAMRVDRAYYAEFDWSGDVLHIYHEYTRTDAASAIGAHPISAFRALLQFSGEGQPLICDDIAAHPIFSSEVDAYRVRRTDGFILMPLVKQSAMVACLCVTMETPRAWAAAEVDLVREVAERTWAAVERARAEAALRASEERFRQFGEASASALWIRNAETL